MNRIILLLALHVLFLWYFYSAFGLVVKDMLHIDVTAHILLWILTSLMKKRSVLGTPANFMGDAANYWPFLLIFLFGILVPVVKSGTGIYILLLMPKPCS